MNRRQFLTGVASLVAAPVLPTPPVEDWLGGLVKLPIMITHENSLVVPQLQTVLVDPKIVEILFRARTDVTNVCGLKPGDIE